MLSTTMQLQLRQRQPLHNKKHLILCNSRLLNNFNQTTKQTSLYGEKNSSAGLKQGDQTGSKFYLHDTTAKALI